MKNEGKTRAYWRKMLPVIMAYVNGDIIEHSCGGLVWNQASTPQFSVYSDNEYRIKPKPKYRPFKNAEEFAPFFNRDMRRKPGRGISSVHRFLAYGDSGVDTIDGFMHYSILFDKCLFADGEPCGLPEREGNK
jgi:hypothetical protein